MGVQANPGISEENGLFLAFSGFSRWSSDPPEKGKKAKKDGKGRKRQISTKGSQTPLKPPSVTPPFAAGQS